MKDHFLKMHDKGKILNGSTDWVSIYIIMASDHLVPLRSNISAFVLLLNVSTLYDFSHVDHTVVCCQHTHLLGHLPEPEDQTTGGLTP